MKAPKLVKKTRRKRLKRLQSGTTSDTKLTLLKFKKLNISYLDNCLFYPIELVNRYCQYFAYMTLDKQLKWYVIIIN